MQTINLVDQLIRPKLPRETYDSHCYIHRQSKIFSVLLCLISGSRNLDV